MTTTTKMPPAFVPRGYSGQGKIDNPTRRPKQLPPTRDTTRKEQKPC